MQATDAKSIRLPDNRRLAYAEYGDPAGQPVFYFHGYPSSRLEAQLLESPARQRNLRVIAPDRNGIGESEPYPERRLLDWPADVEALADALDIEQFYLVGVSGGGPYALACAYRSGIRLEGIALVCPLGPLEQAGLLDTMRWTSRLAVGSLRHAPRLTRLLFQHVLARLVGRHTDLMYNWLISLTSSPDQQVLSRSQVRATITRSVSESLRHGANGLYHELEIYSAPWGFDLADIRQSVQLWHGSEDRVVPQQHGRCIADRLSQCDAHFIIGEGHYSLPIDHMENILDRLIEG